MSDLLQAAPGREQVSGSPMGSSASFPSIGPAQAAAVRRCPASSFFALAGARLNANHEGIGTGAKSLLGPSLSSHHQPSSGRRRRRRAGGQAARNWVTCCQCQGPRIKHKRASLKFFLN